MGVRFPPGAQMYFLYILRSERDENLYIGITNNLKRRLSKHNKGKSKSTKHRKPFILIYRERYGTRSKAAKREWYFKNTTEKDRGPGFKYTRLCKYKSKDKIQINEFHISWKNNPDHISIEKHKQIVMNPKDVMNLIPLSKFSLLGMYHDFMTINAIDSSNRIHFVLQKHSNDN